MKRLLWSGALALTLALPASVWAQGKPATPPANDEFDRVVVNPPDGLAISDVEVENALGSVRIEGHDRPEMVVEATKHAGDSETLKRLSVAVSPRTNGKIHIGTSLEAGNEMRPIAAGSIRIDLTIKVPRKARPEVSVWKGNVFIAGVDNGAEVSANQADVDMRRVSGSISSHITSGRQQFMELSGVTMDASTLTGDMALDWVNGDVLDAWAQTGDLVAKRVRFRQLSLRTVHGDVRVIGVLALGGSYELSSYDGDVEIDHDGSVPLRIKTFTAEGRVGFPDEFRDRMTVDGDSKIFNIDGGTKAAKAGKIRPAEVRLRSQRGDVRIALVKYF